MKVIVKGIYKAVDKLCDIMTAVGFATIVIVLGVQIVLRNLGTSLMWAEEVARYIYIWLLFTGAARAFSRGGHLTVDILFAKFNKKIQLALMVIYYLAILGFTVYFFYTGVQLAKFQWTSPMYTVPWFKLGWVDLCIPFGCTLTILYVLREIFYMITMGVKYLDKGDTNTEKKEEAAE